MKECVTAWKNVVDKSFQLIVVNLTSFDFLALQLFNEVPVKECKTKVCNESFLSVVDVEINGV